MAHCDTDKTPNVPYTDPDLQADPLSIVIRDAADQTLLGSHPLVPQLQRDDEEDVPDPDAPPPPPPPPVSLPEMALQFRPCLEDRRVPPADVIDAVKAETAAESDVRYVCAAGTGRIGIWFRAATTDQAREARARGTARIEIVRPNEQFGVFINAAFIRAVAAEAFAKEPKRRNHAGKEQADGPVHLTGQVVDFQFPNKIVTTISGFDESAFPDVDFRLIITDTLRVSGNSVELDSVVTLDVDRRWIHVLAGLSELAAGFHLAFHLAAAGFIGESVIIGSQDPDDTRSGAGGTVAERIPSDVLIRGGNKLVPVYRRLAVSTAGVVAAGGVLIVPREPIVSIAGATRIAVTEGETSVTRSYQANTHDLRLPRFRWTVAGTAATDRRRVTKVTFDLTGLEPGKQVLRSVRVTATDADNLTATAAVGVRIFMTSAEDVPDLPPICRLRPWLPQCHPEGEV